MAAASSKSAQRAVRGGLLRVRAVFQARAQRVAPGEQVADRFQILEELGRGGFGCVYKARDSALFDQPVALKLLHPERLQPAARAEPERLLLLFAREAQATAQLKHHNIVTLLAFGTWQRPGGPVLPYLVTELLEGETLARRLRSGAMPLADALDIAQQLVAALAHAHTRDVLHLDIKPSNLFLEPDGHLKILDFGLARIGLSAESTADANELLPYAGTYAYLPPEQRSSRARGVQSDLYAATTVLLEVLTGVPPRGRVVLSEAMLAGWPPALGALLQRGLHACAEHRFACAAELQAAVEAVRQTLRGDAQSVLEPYRHLAAFQAEHAPLFFGRERLSAALRRRLEDEPLLLLVGASGAGKSSLVRAGLMPRLTAPWHSVILEPGSQPLVALLQRLRALGSPSMPALSGVEAQPARIGQALRQAAEARGQRVLLIIDQLEECFTQVGSAAQRQAFLACLLAAADDPSSPIRVLLVLREDFLSRLGESPELFRRASAQPFLLGQPNETELRAALVQPAAQRGFAFEAGLAEGILAELRAESAPLPLLQLLASKLWEGRDESRRLLSRRMYDALGGVGGVLSAHADGVLDRLGDPSLRALALDLCGALITPAGTRRALERERLLAQLGGASNALVVLDALLRGRLVQSFRRDRAEVIELAHESLIARWPALQGRLGQDPAQRRLSQQLQADTATWLARKQPKHLLWRGASLDEVLLERTRGRLLLPPDLAAFIAQCVRLRKRGRWGRVLAVTGVFGLLGAFTVVRSVQLQTEQGLRQDAELAQRLTKQEQQRTELARQNAELAQHKAELAQQLTLKEIVQKQAAEKKVLAALDLVRRESSAKEVQRKLADERAEQLQKEQVVTKLQSEHLHQTNVLLGDAPEVERETDQLSRRGAHGAALFRILGLIHELRARKQPVRSLLSVLTASMARARAAAGLPPIAQAILPYTSLRAALWDEDPDRIFLAGVDGVVSISVAMGTTTRVLPRDSREVQALARSAAGHLLVLREGGELLVLDPGLLVPSARSIGALHLSGTERVVGIGLGPGEHALLGVRSGRSLYIRQLGTESADFIPLGSGALGSQAVSALHLAGDSASGLIILGGYQGKVLSVRGSSPVAHYNDPHEAVGGITTVAISSQAPRVVAAGDQLGWVRLWTESGELLARFQDDVPKALRHLVLAPHGDRVLVIGADARARIYDVTLGALIQSACALQARHAGAQGVAAACRQ